MNKGKGNHQEKYWKKYNDHIQRGLNALGILEVLPDVEYPKPNKVVRIFLTNLENRFGESDLGIRKQVVGPILSVIQMGLFVAETPKEKATWFMKIVAKLGINMSIGNALEILDGLRSMDDFLLHQVKRKFENFFIPKETQETPAEDSDDNIDGPGNDDDDLAEEEMVTVAADGEEGETPE